MKATFPGGMARWAGFATMALAGGLCLPAAVLAQGAPELRSDVAGLVLTAISVLPSAAAPVSGEVKECAGYFTAPKTTVAGIAAAAGWAITGEASLGRFQAVSLAAGVTAGWGGRCTVHEGKAVLFDGMRPVAIASASAGSPMVIGSIVGLEPDGFRIWNGEFPFRPVADMHLAGDGAIVIAPVAPAESRCEGRVSVPNIYGLRIDAARLRLAAMGWKPGIATRDPGLDLLKREDDLVTAGFSELVSCAVSSLGYCAFEYRAAPVALTVVTAGEEAMPVVIGYRVDCGAAN